MAAGHLSVVGVAADLSQPLTLDGVPLDEGSFIRMVDADGSVKSASTCSSLGELGLSPCAGLPHQAPNHSVKVSSSSNSSQEFHFG